MSGNIRFVSGFLSVDFVKIIQTTKAGPETTKVATQTTNAAPEPTKVAIQTTKVVPETTKPATFVS